jgi:hypothetical protein
VREEEGIRKAEQGMVAEHWQDTECQTTIAALISSRDIFARTMLCCCLTTCRIEI